MASPNAAQSRTDPGASPTAPAARHRRRGRATPRLGLRARLALLVAVAALPALLLFLQHAQTERALLVSEAESRALRLARAWADNHDALLREAHLVLLAAARDPATVGDDGAACGDALGRLAGRVGWPTAVAVFGRDGALVCASQADRSPFSGLDRSFLAGLFDNPTLDVSEFALDPSGHSLAFAGLRVPLRGRAGPPEFRVAVTVIDLAVIAQRTARDADGAQYNIMVLDRTGRLLARAPQAAGLVGTRLPMDHPLKPALNVRLEGTAEGRGLDGVERIFAFTQLPQTGAKVAVGLTRSEVIGPQEREQDWLLAALLGVAALAAAAAWLVGELSVLRWVRVLDRAANAFARGDFAHRATLPRGTSVELSRLALTFNRMAANLNLRSAALAASERRFRDIAEVSGDWIWERDEAGVSTYLSGRFTEVTGIPVARLLGTRIEALAALGVAAHGIDRMIRAFGERSPFRDLVHRLDGADGRRQYWRVSGTPIFDGDGAFRGYRGTGSNVTDEVEGEVALRDAKDAAEAASRAKSQFLATMSHELRTPLNAVIGFSELLVTGLAGELSAKQREYLRDIHGSGAHLLAIVDDILDVAKADADHLDLTDTVIDLEALLDGAVRLLAGQAARSGIAIDVSVAPEARTVRADERRLRQVLLNVVGNALKFTRSGGSVRVGTRLDPDGLVIRVADNGVGIAPDDLARVTEPFWQAARDLTRTHEGVGLGLAVSRRIVESHGGRLTLKSVIGTGTTVDIMLPLQRAMIAV